MLSISNLRPIRTNRFLSGWQDLTLVVSVCLPRCNVLLRVRRFTYQMPSVAKGLLVLIICSKCIYQLTTWTRRPLTRRRLQVHDVPGLSRFAMKWGDRFLDAVCWRVPVCKQRRQSEAVILGAWNPLALVFTMSRPGSIWHSSLGNRILMHDAGVRKVVPSVVTANMPFTCSITAQAKACPI